MTALKETKAKPLCGGCGLFAMEKAGFPVGTIRVWKGKKYIKVAPGKWKPQSEGGTQKKSGGGENNGHGNSNKSRFLNHVDGWLVELAKQTGLDIAGYRHKVTEDFKRHVEKRHGNPSTETKRGQIAVTREDLDKIESIINTPDFAVAGIKRNGRDRIILVKNTEHGSVLVEEILDGKRNKTLNAKTFWITKNPVSVDSLKKRLEISGIYDVSKMRAASRADAVSALSSAKTTEDGRNPTVNSPSDSTVPQSGGSVKKSWWCWFDQDGRLWFRKSALKALKGRE